MKPALWLLPLIGVVATPSISRAGDIETDHLKHSYHYVWSTCSGCGPSKRGLHLYVSQVVFANHYDHKNLGGPFFDAVRKMPNGSPNGQYSNGFKSYAAGRRARQRFISSFNSKRYTVHRVRWPSRWTGDHGMSRRIKTKRSKRRVNKRRYNNRRLRGNLNRRYNSVPTVRPTVPVRYNTTYRKPYVNTYRKPYRNTYRKPYRNTYRKPYRNTYRKRYRPANTYNYGYKRKYRSTYRSAYPKRYNYKRSFGRRYYR